VVVVAVDLAGADCALFLVAQRAMMRSRAGFFLLLATCLSLAGCHRDVGFTDVAAESGIVDATYSGPAKKTRIRETMGQGVCWIDYDRDGDPDLFVPNGPGHAWHLYENRNGRFIDAAPSAGLAISAWGIGCAVADVDNDGYDDLFVTTAAEGNRLFHNRGNKTFESWTERSGLGTSLLSASAAFGDVDGDGDLDLFVAAYLDESKAPAPESCVWKGAKVMCGPKGFPPLDGLLYLNNGDGTFVLKSAERGIAGHPGFGLGVIMLDADQDGDTDLYVANDSSPSHLFLNDGHGVFREAGLGAGVALSQEGASQAGMGVDSGDLDGDGLPDIIKTNFSDDVNNFYHNDGKGYFTEWSQRSGLAEASFKKLGWAPILEDFDLDGDLDLLVVNGHVYPGVEQIDPNTTYRQEMQLFLNDGKGKFRQQPEIAGTVFRSPISGRSAAAADFDGDGDMDVAISRDGEPPLLLKNDLASSSNHWVKVRLRGVRSNRSGIGATVEVEAGGKLQRREMRSSRGYLGSSETILVFGLGDVTRILQITIRWPSGTVQTLHDLETRREYLITEVVATPNH
jgi:hypothetical protein